MSSLRVVDEVPQRWWSAISQFFCIKLSVGILTLISHLQMKNLATNFPWKNSLINSHKLMTTNQASKAILCWMEMGKFEKNHCTNCQIHPHQLQILPKSTMIVLWTFGAKGGAMAVPKCTRWQQWWMRKQQWLGAPAMVIFQAKGIQ